MEIKSGFYLEMEELGMRGTKIILLFLWAIAGICTILSRNPSMLSYILCWIFLLMELIEDVFEGK